MKRYILLLSLVCGLATACKKDQNPPPPVPEPPVNGPLLKTIIQDKLPSPYYQIQYNGAGQPTRISFASGLADYLVNRNNNQLSSLKNLVPAGEIRLEYQYQDGKPFLIKLINPAGEMVKRCFLTYSGNQLIKMEWERSIPNLGFASDKTLALEYYPDGNLKLRTLTRHSSNENQTEIVLRDEFLNYDTNVNVDGFALLHPEDEHLILLPAAIIQKNNPGKIIRTGTGVHYTIDYQYQLNSSRQPLIRTGEMEIQTGQDAGKKVVLKTWYEY